MWQNSAHYSKSRNIFYEYDKIYGRKSQSEIFDTIIDLANGHVLEYNKPYIQE